MGTLMLLAAMLLGWAAGAVHLITLTIDSLLPIELKFAIVLLLSLSGAFSALLSFIAIREIFNPLPEAHVKSRIV